MIRMIPIDEQQPRAGQLCMVLYGEGWFGIGAYAPQISAFGHDTDDGEVAFYEDVTHWLPLSLVQLGKGEAYLDWGKDGVKTSAAELNVPVEQAWRPIVKRGPAMTQLDLYNTITVNEIIPEPEVRINDIVGQRDQPFTDPGELTDDEAFGEEYAA